MNAKPLRTSASDIETADPKNSGCYRKWYFKKVAKLKVPPSGSTTFGDVLHAVCERFLLADENGNTNGKPVELYPEGWERPVNRHTGEPSKESVTLEEQAIIKALISKAISEGILMRVAGREIERTIRNFEIMDGVLLNGFIDLLEPGAIRDHKSTKSMKWAKSIKREASESLYTNVQLMTYAYWYYTKGGFDKSKPCALSHQYFVKDAEKPRTEKREVSVTWPEVEAFYIERLAPVMEMILVYRDAQKYTDIPLPDDVAGACRKFGGCPFTRICTEQETVNEYKKRVEVQLSGSTDTNYTQVANDLPQGGKTMSRNPMMEKIKAMQAAKRGEAVEAAPVEVKETPAPVEAAPVEDTCDRPKAPWHHASCKSCVDNPILGLNSKQTLPCKICDMFTKKDGGKASDQYKWSVAEGSLIVTDKETGELVMTNTVTEGVTAKEVLAPVAEETKTITKPVVETTTTEVPLEKAKASEAPASEPVSTVFENLEITTEREKFTILIGCAVIESKIKGGGKLGSPSCRVTAEELMILVEMEMQKILGAAGWARLNGFEKRDAIAIYSKMIADLLGSSTLTVARMPKASILEAVVMGIRPYAGSVIQALAD